MNGETMNCQLVEWNETALSWREMVHLLTSITSEFEETRLKLEQYEWREVIDLAVSYLGEKSEDTSDWIHSKLIEFQKGFEIEAKRLL